MKNLKQKDLISIPLEENNFTPSKSLSKPEHGIIGYQESVKSVYDKLSNK